MTLQTPQLLPISAFDPKYECVVRFIYDDVQIIRNRLLITNNDNGEVVYDKIQDGLRTQHTINPNTLESGTAYIAQIQVFDKDNNKSILSDPVLFHCFSTPIFCFSDLKNGDVIYKNSIKLSIFYSQSEDEKLKDIQFYLYTHDNSIRNYSDLIYSDKDTYTFYDLKNETSYYVQAIGHTINGMYVDTGKILINIKYVSIPANIIFQVENNKKNGYITLFSGIVDIGYDIDNDKYLIENGAVTIWDDNRITYNKGFSIEGDFILHLESKKIPLEYPFLRLNNDIELSIVEITNGFYCKLTGVNCSQYVRLPNAKLISDIGTYIVTKEGKRIEIIKVNNEYNGYIIYEIKRSNGIYGLDVYYKIDG